MRNTKSSITINHHWYCNWTVISSRQGFPYRVRWRSVQTPHGDHPRKNWKLVKTSSWSELHNYVIAVMWRGNYVVVTEREVHGKSTVFGYMRLHQRWEVMWPAERTVESATAKWCSLLELNAVGLSQQSCIFTLWILSILLYIPQEEPLARPAVFTIGRAKSRGEPLLRQYIYKKETTQPIRCQVRPYLSLNTGISRSWHAYLWLFSCCICSLLLHS